MKVIFLATVFLFIVEILGLPYGESCKCQSKKLCDNIKTVIKLT